MHILLTCLSLRFSQMKERGVKMDDVKDEIRDFVEKVGPVVGELERGIRERNFWDLTRV